MAKTNTSFALGEQWDEYLRQQVQGGAYHSASEVVREALREHRERREKERQLDEAIAKGLASPPSALTHDEVWQQLHARHPWLKT